MIKQAPSLGRILAMVLFALSCFGLLMFLWLAFGGPIPLRPEGYRFQAAFPEAATLAQEADVRLAGVNVGKVKTKKLDKGAARTLVEIELESRYAPIPKDTRAILRQKTLLGETYVELAPGHESSGDLPDGARLPNSRIQPAVELDEIFNAFDKPTRQAFQEWMAELTRATRGGADRDLNDAFGNLAPFAVDGETLLQVLDEQDIAVRRLIKNTGRVFGAINQREGALRSLIVNANNTFEATASRDVALAETFRIFPTFLDESRATLARLERFSRNTHPLVNDLKGPADDLAPTVRDLGRLAPHLERLFRDLDPLIRASARGLPSLERVLRGLRPVLRQLHPFFQELTPILSFMNFHQTTVAGFLANGGANLQAKWGPEGSQPRRVQVQTAIIDGRSFERYTERPFFERGNAYLEPNALLRALPLGTIESFDCEPAGGEQPYPRDADGPPPPGDPSPLPIGPIKNEQKAPPCFVEPPSLWDSRQFPYPRRGQTGLRRPPRGLEGNRPARRPNPPDVVP